MKIPRAEEFIAQHLEKKRKFLIAASTEIRELLELTTSVEEGRELELSLSAMTNLDEPGLLTIAVSRLFTWDDPESSDGHKNHFTRSDWVEEDKNLDYLLSQEICVETRSRVQGMRRLWILLALANNWWLQVFQTKDAYQKAIQHVIASY